MFPAHNKSNGKGSSNIHSAGEGKLSICRWQAMAASGRCPFDSDSKRTILIYRPHSPENLTPYHSRLGAAVEVAGEAAVAEEEVVVVAAEEAARHLHYR